MKTQAALYYATGGPHELQEIDLVEPGTGEVLVRIVASGLCHTDVTVHDFAPLPMPAILGHEGAGIVEKIGSGVTKVAVGDHVIMTTNSCGHCRCCVGGNPSLCENFAAVNMSGGHRHDGTCTHTRAGAPVFAQFLGQSSFAAHVLANERSVCKVAPELPLDLLAPLGCGVQTGFGTVMNTLRVRPGSSIAVFGAGTVGLSAIMAAKVSGASQIIAVDLNPQRLELARELGATTVINGLERDAAADIKTSGGVDYSIEATGVAVVMEQAVNCLRSGGTAALVGVAMGAKISLDPSILQSGNLTVKGSLMAGAGTTPDVFLPLLIGYWRDGRLPLEKLVRFYAFDDINQAFHDAHEGHVIKAVLRMATTEQA